MNKHLITQAEYIMYRLENCLNTPGFERLEFSRKECAKLADLLQEVLIDDAEIQAIKSKEYMFQQNKKKKE